MTSEISGRASEQVISCRNPASLPRRCKLLPKAFNTTFDPINFLKKWILILPITDYANCRWAGSAGK